MQILNYLLHLFLTLLIALPFITVGASAIISSYFQYKEKHMKNVALAGVEHLDKFAKKMAEISKEKNNG